MSATANVYQRGNAPFVMPLHRVCQLIEKGQTFTVEFHPVFNASGTFRGKIIGRLGLHIMDGGDVAIQLLDGSTTIMTGLTLANYGSLWRVWQNGTPYLAQRKRTKWRVR